MKTARCNMRAERARKGLTIEQVGKAIGVHPNAISRWENGESFPTASNLIALCNLYECSPEYLLDMTNDERGTAVVT